MKITSIHIERYCLAREQTVLTSKVSAVIRHGWWISLRTDSGLIGRGDAAPWPGFGDGFQRNRTALGTLPSELIGLSPTTLLKSIADHEPHTLWPSAVRFAIETACLDVLGQSQGRSVASLLSTHPRRCIPTNCIVQDAEDAYRALDQGFNHFKVKVGADLIDEDVQRVRRIRAAIGEDKQLWLDANGAWSMSEAPQALQRLADVNPAWVEQPVQGVSPEELAQLKAGSPIPLALDEDLTSLGRLNAFMDADALDVAVIKPMFVGGVSSAQQMVQAAEARGVRVMITCALESRIGRIATAHLAVSTKTPIIAYGAGHPLRGDPHESHSSARPMLYCPTEPGLGLERRPHGSTIPNAIANHAVSRPEACALVVGKTRLTWRVFHEQIRGLAAGLMEQGLKTGEVVGVRGENDRSWIICWHALNYIGAIGVPMSKNIEGHRLLASLDRCCADWLLLTDSHSAEPGIDTIPILRPKISTAPIMPHVWALEALQVLLFSSGTTGPAKLVPISTRQIVFSSAASAFRLGHLPTDQWLACLPFEHMGGLAMILRTALYGTCLVLELPFNPDAVNRALDNQEITQLSVVPTMLTRLLNARGDAPFHSRLRCILLGGAAAPSRLVERCQAIGAPIALTWGMSETASQIATSPPGCPSPLGSVGPPLPFVAVSIVDRQLAIDGPLAPGATFVTQDIGTIDEHGWIHITARADDVINTGGKLVAPSPIEDCLRKHPSIDDVAIVGLADEDWGQRIVACVVSSVGDLTAAELNRWCRRYLMPHECPKSFKRADVLERTELGKLKRAAIRRSCRRWPDLQVR